MTVETATGAGWAGCLGDGAFWAMPLTEAAATIASKTVRKMRIRLFFSLYVSANERRKRVVGPVIQL